MKHKEFSPIIYWMDDMWLTTFLSESKVDKKTIEHILVAMKKYNKAINDAGKELERDLKKSQNPTVRVRKPLTKK